MKSLSTLLRQVLLAPIQACIQDCRYMQSADMFMVLHAGHAFMQHVHCISVSVLLDSSDYADRQHVA